MAAANALTIDIEGVKAHGASSSWRRHCPGRRANHQCHPSFVSRDVDPLKSEVVRSACLGRQYRQRHTATVVCAVRRAALPADVRELLEKRLPVIVENTAAAYGAKATLTYRRGYPVLVNHEQQTGFAASVAGQIAGDDKVDTTLPPMMGAEDFSFMLNARPGAFIWIGNGASAGLHHPAYNFNDDAIPFGTSYWVKLVETALTG